MTFTNRRTLLGGKLFAVEDGEIGACVQHVALTKAIRRLRVERDLLVTPRSRS